MRYRVGLDVGTASLGVAAFSIDADNNPIDLVWNHVRIFDEPLEKSQAGLKSKKAGRRAARMQRRQIDRRLSRTKQIAALAQILGIEIEPSIDSGASLLAIRAQAARVQISLSDLMRVFVKMGKRRGYGGAFKAKKENAVLGEVEGGSKDLDKAMALIAETRGLNTITVGEYLFERWQQGLPTKLKIKEKRDKEDSLQNLYALRSHIEAEFEQIWQTQAAFYPDFNAEHNGQAVKEKFKHAIFYQRPLKAVGGMVGQCSLEPTHARSPRAQLAFQRFRIEKTLADLRWGAGGRAKNLNQAQRAVIRQLCDEKEVVKFEAIYKALKAAGCPKPDGKGLNLERLSRDEIPGNKTNHVFNKMDLGEDWANLDNRTKIQVINFLADLGSPEQLDDPLWHTRFAKTDGTPRSLPEPFIAFINTMKDSGKLERLSKMGFEGGRASYSIKALDNITEWLDAPWWPDDWDDAIDGAKNVGEDGAIRVVYRAQFIKQRETTLKTQLEAPPATGNSVVDGSLRQIRYVVNRMIADLGAVPEQIVVEMARDMSVGVSMRNERESDNNKNRKARLTAEKAISDAGVTVTPSRIRRYLLWVEQGEGHCPYCSRTINLSDAMYGAETEYEHILPKSLTQVGLKRSEIVLAHRSCNQEKGNRTPFQAFGNDAERWQIIQMRAKFFSDKKAFCKAKLLLLEDFENEVLTDDSIAGFADRQFHQTSWIAKEAALWLQSISKTPVSVSRGEMTAGLRKKWKLETVIPQVRVEEGLPILDEEGAVVSAEDFAKYRDVWEGHKVLDNHGKLDKTRHTDRRLDKRIDHRHHLIDAITIALTSRKLFAEMARQYKIDSERVGVHEKPRLRIGETMPLKTVRELALKAARECLLSIKPDRYPDGAIFQETAYGVAVKEGEDKARLTLRNKVESLIDPKKGTTDQAYKAINTIVSAATREVILKAFEARIAAGKTATQALSEPIYQQFYGQKMAIKKVNCFTATYADNVAIISHTSKDGREHSKRMINGGYAYLEAEIREGRLIGQPNLVKIQQAMKAKKLVKREGFLRYYKGDTVLDMSDGKKYRIGMFKAAAGFFLVPITEPRAYNAIEEPNSGKKSLSFNQVAKLRLI